MSFGPGSFNPNQGMMGPRGTRCMMGPKGMDGRDGKDGISKEKYQRLKKRLKMLEQKVEAMWDAPGMPGSNAILDELDELNNSLIIQSNHN